ncbi:MULTISPECIES: glycosyltransferase family 4 protein [Lactiplantibacillus]|mgnify:FL=1|uniref:glycosyltransferase family 4 protein n=1 Tax=Lactiplantibacillus TaxID=2767842 RepID=UPI00073BA528|nr:MULTISPECIES: glycosyltransferase [Lactiplantibacillus]GEK64745.1 glycosyl transferase [Lactobacillus japonicus]KTF02997.1 Glycosyltransferase LafB responsible for the formation of Gal-Glc-DAG [Lactiplantibacillus plantarum]KZT83790.1 Glycosyltransferase LafB responsible for theformation of Gal-Glc-DAG [Lactiplantibacillus plantarum]MCA5599082.1 glycosyltransferase [Lactiplantibacillus argentoratensis]MCB4210053.1 glycosyltransferase [Lactiplantibacillus plantarum]
MLDITMFSKADSVKGQGVGSAYLELMRLLRTHWQDEFNIKVNRYGRSAVSHYHTVNPMFYLSTFMPNRGRKIGYVHFLPETLEGSLKLPRPFQMIFNRYLISFYKRMDHIVVVNPTFIPKLEAYHIKRADVTYIPNFVSKREFYEMTKAKQLRLRQQYGYDQSKFMIIGTGQIQDRKGVPDFITLAKQNPDIQFVWAGGFSFGRITDGYQELKQVVDNPPANLSFPGIVPREKLVDYYNMADLFLLPSYNELFPMSVLEAFSCGTPVLLRDLDLYRAIIDGYYQAASDVDDMQRQIDQLRHNPAGLQFLHDKAVLAAQDYSEERLAKVWHDFYLQQAKEG